jgi:hypothetical protein
MVYLVLIGDLIASRDSKNRKDLQKQIKSVLRQVNERTPKPVSPYTLTLGDEFQAVFENADHIFEDIVQILWAMHPVQVRFSLGLGEITTDLNTEQALGMDGPAFYLARDGINQLKEDGGLIRLEGLPEPWDALAESSLFLVNRRIKKWDINRLAILHGLLSGKDKKVIAADLGITAQAVYKNISTGELAAVIEYLKALTNILNKCLGVDLVSE